MAFLGRARKEDLRILADELGEVVSPEMKIIELKSLILKSPNYEEEFVKGLLERIATDRLEEAAEKKAELEAAQKTAELQAAEKRAEREYELQRLRIQATGSIGTGTNGESRSQGHTSKHKLRDLIPKLDPKTCDIGLYLKMFECQARRLQIDQEEWVSYLMALLPMDLSQQIARESEEVTESYERVRALLLKRLKLSPEKFRQRLVQAQKRIDGTWQDFALELSNFLDEWVDGLDVKDFAGLKKLMVVDQIKRRVSSDVRDHFADEWLTVTCPSKLSEMLDDYDSVRSTFKRPSGGFQKPWEKHRQNPREFPKKEQKLSKEDKPSSVEDRASTSQNTADQTYEHRRKPRCYECNQIGHYRVQCPKRTKSKDSEPVTVNNISEEQGKRDYLAPYVVEGKVNGVPCSLLVDTGASMDVTSKKFVNSDDFTGETIWVKSPIHREQVCLPLAHVTLEGKFGKLQTKAAVVSPEIHDGPYILSNRSRILLEERGNFQNFVGAVLTRAQKRQIEKDNAAAEIPANTPPEASNEEGTDHDNAVDDLTILPAVDSEGFELALSKVGGGEVALFQRDSEDLNSLFAAAEKPQGQAHKYYKIERNLLYRYQRDHLGNFRRLLVIPEKLRMKIMALCHEGTSGHLGVTKSKDRLARYFFWPQCYKSMEEFVRTCDSCQRAGKPNERKKAPLKLVPVIQEVFSKINIDTCGPLPETPGGKRYLVTAICLSSKYPEAIPVVDIRSTTITDALMLIFSRIGFPKEIQCDQGTSFMSALTTEFFERFGIRVRHSSVHHPQSNPVERLHRTIKRIIRVLCIEAGPDWERHLPWALLALRTATHESTGYTPAELVHGKNLRTPETLIFEQWSEGIEEEKPVTEYVLGLINRLKRCQELAVTNMEENQKKRKLWYDKHAVKREFRPGDLVLVLATSKPHKLAVQWIGPGEIQAKLSETNYIVKLAERKESQIYHVNMLKSYHKRPEVINYLMSESGGTELELEFPYIDGDPNVFDFTEIERDSNLRERLGEAKTGQLLELLQSKKRGFSNVPGLTDLVIHDIELVSNKPIRSRPYKMSRRQNELLKSEIDRMLRLGIVEIGESDYTSPMILVEAPGKDPRPCVDYRRLNEVIRTEFFPIPNIEERVERVAAARYITILDMAKGYWQIPLSPRAQRYAAFVTSFGSFRPLRMAFGLKNAPFFFSKLMSQILKGCENFAVPYLDDIAIFSKDWETHLRDVAEVLERIVQAKLTLKPSKCRFAQEQVKYLGHIVGNGARTPAQAKVNSIAEFPCPTTKTHIRSFLGLAGYYAHYIPDYSSLAAPLTDALRGKRKRESVLWSDDCEKAFQVLKAKLMGPPVLYAPDFEKEFVVQTDCSNVGMGVVLTQQTNGEEHPILYLSRKLTDVEKKIQYEREGMCRYSVCGKKATLLLRWPEVHHRHGS